MGHDPRTTRYRELTRRAAGLVREGDSREALLLYSAAHELARAADDPQLLDEALTNLSMVRLELGELDAAKAGLREIILRSGSDVVIQAAAYNLASALRREGRYDRALFYARLAMDKAVRTGDDARRARCHNLLGNVLLNQSQLGEALDQYRQALSAGWSRRREDKFFMAILLENLGYCRLLSEQHARGHRLLRRALSLADEIGDRRCQAECLQDLSYADLLRGRPREARSWGMRALALALRKEFSDIEKNCYFLLGEASQRLGDEAGCEQWFSKLQCHYPQIPNLSDFLRTFDVTKVLNFKA